MLNEQLVQKYDMIEESETFKPPYASMMALWPPFCWRKGIQDIFLN